ncbi:MAG: DUF1801 domain-containing protein [Dehalococcoidia bacterium]
MADGKDSQVKSTIEDVDGYLATVPDEARATLQELRRIIRAAAPEAVESISYGMPTFKHRGWPLVYIGAAKKHCALHAISSSIMEAHRDELKGYGTSKGGVRFPIGKPVPAALVEKLVKARLTEVEKRTAK